MTYRLAILETHPIQYRAPWLRLLHAHPEIDLTVFFCMVPDAKQQGRGFGVEFTWDIPLLEGYHYEILENRAKVPGTERFGGCDTPEIGRWVRDGGFDAFLVSGWLVKSMLQCAWACRRYGVPCIVRGDSNDMPPRAWWKTWVHRRLFGLFSAFLVVGKSNRDFYLKRGVAAGRIVPGPHCIESARFAQAAESAQAKRPVLRERWSIPADAVCFLFCGKLEPKKRPMDLLEALAMAAKQTEGQGPEAQPAGVSSSPLPPASPPPPRLHLLVVGDGELRGDCEAYAREHRLPVSFTGFLNQSEIPQAYAAADCLVLPSDYGETWGLVVNEAFACGLPAIVSDRVGCHPDLILRDRTGWVVPFGDTPALADALALAARDPGQLRTMGEAARTHIGAYSIETLVEGTLAALRLVTASR